MENPSTGGGCGRSQPRNACAPSSGRAGPLFYPVSLRRGESGTTGPQGSRRGDGMDPGVETTQERLPDA